MVVGASRADGPRAPAPKHRTDYPDTVVPAEPDSLAVSIHGPAGVVDLLVPPGAQAVDLAREYAEQSGLASIPLIYSLGGVAVRPDMALDDAGVHSGAPYTGTSRRFALSHAIARRRA